MGELIDVLLGLGVDASALLLGLARVAPVALLVPALGLRWWPVPLRVGFAFVLAVSVVPIVVPSPPPIGPALVGTLVSHVLAGVPIALGAAALLWAVSMASGVYQQLLDEPTAGAASEPLGEAGIEAGGFTTLMSLAVWIAFLEMGGPARVALALARAPVDPAEQPHVIATAVAQLVGSIELAVGFALPALVVWVLSYVVLAVARGIAIRPWSDVLASLRPLVALVLLALLFERVLEDVVAHVGETLPRP